MDTTSWKPEVLAPEVEAHAVRIAALRAAGVEIVDQMAALLGEIATCMPQAGRGTERVVYYPWRGVAVRLPEARVFHRIREDRNRLKIDDAEARAIHAARIGIVGLSTGYAVAMALISLGVQRFRLADFDALELTNLNRIPASLVDIGLNKAVSAARRMAEINPYAEIEIRTQGVAVADCPEFVAGLDQVIEVCDSFPVKVALREAARAARIPVIMNTSDRCMLDVERFDTDPGRPLFHGLAGDLTLAGLAGLGREERVGLALRIVGAGQTSTEMGVSLFEIDRSLRTWPQLASDVTSGAGAVADIVRRIATGRPVASGRSFGQSYLDLAEPEADPARLPPAPPRDTDCATGDLKADMVAAARLAPTGGNAQRWRIGWDGDRLEIAKGAGPTVAMDIGERGSLVGVGAAWMNARALAASRGRLGAAALHPGGSGWVALGPGDGGLPAHLGQAVAQRVTNRRRFETRAVPEGDIAALRAAAAAEGGALTVFAGDSLAPYVDFLARAERLRFLSPRLHADLARELIWPGTEPVRRGLDVRTLELSPPDLEKVRLALRGDIMAVLRARNLGAALGDPVRAAFAAAGLAAVVTCAGDGPETYLSGGAALERVWLEATHRGLQVQPWSPCFLFAQTPEEAAALMPAELQAEARALFGEWEGLVGLGPQKAILALRLGYGPAPTAVSLREAAD